MRTLMIRSYDELREVDHRAVIVWERIMGELDGAAPSTVRCRPAMKTRSVGTTPATSTRLAAITFLADSTPAPATRPEDTTPI